MKVETHIKHDQIVEAALRRFSHFGIGKTTLTEVADDSGLTKQVLSYYFHDKQSLVNAVVEKLTRDYFNVLRPEIEKATSVKTGLLKLTEVKAVFFEKYFLLIVQADQLELIKQQSFQSWRKILAEKELTLLKNLFEKGVATGELKASLDAKKTGELLLDTLYAFSRCVKDKGALPDESAFRDVLARQREVIELFYQGLKSETWVN